MKIATWNVNGFRAAFDKGLADFKKTVEPDIFCIQETKAHPDQLKDSQKNLYPYEYWSICGKKKGYSGTAILSKKPALNILKGMGIKKFDWEGRMLIFEEKHFLLLNVYFPNGALTLQRHLFKQEFFKKISSLSRGTEAKNKKRINYCG